MTGAAICGAEVFGLVDVGLTGSLDSAIAVTFPPRAVGEVCPLSLDPGLPFRSRVVRMLKTSWKRPVNLRRCLASASSVGETLRSSRTCLRAAIRSWGVASRIKRGLSSSHIMLCLRELRRLGSEVSRGGARSLFDPAVPGSDVADLEAVAGLKSMRQRGHVPDTLSNHGSIHAG